MKILNISEVRSHLPSVIENVVNSNEPVIITRYGKPIASIVPFNATQASEARYPLRGRPMSLAADFDEPMPGLWSAVNE